MQKVSLKAFALYLMVLGVAFLVAGLTLYLTNRPDPTLSDNMVNAFLNLPLVYDRSFRQGIGEMLLVAGGILFVSAGIGWVAARKSDSASSGS